MNIDKLIPRGLQHLLQFRFGSLMNIDKLILIVNLHDGESGFDSLMNIKLKETACGILW